MREHSFIFLNKNLPNSAQALRMCTLEIEKKIISADLGRKLANCRSGGVDPQTGGGGKARSVGRGGGTGSMEGLGK